MKLKHFLMTLSALLLLCLSLPEEAYGQAKGKQGPPPWAPAHGYRAKTRHIYFPQHNFYFDVQKGIYIFLNGSSWQMGLKLPSLYANLDLRRATQIELDLDNDHPHKFNGEHKAKYKTKPQGSSQQSKSKGPAPKPAAGNGNPNRNSKGKKH